MSGGKEEKKEAAKQIRYLWKITFPILLDNIFSEDKNLNIASRNLLNFMRDEEVSDLLIEKSYELENIKEIRSYIGYLESFKYPPMWNYDSRYKSNKNNLIYNEKILPAINILKSKLN